MGLYDTLHNAATYNLPKAAANAGHRFANEYFNDPNGTGTLLSAAQKALTPGRALAADSVPFINNASLSASPQASTGAPAPSAPVELPPSITTNTNQTGGTGGASTQQVPITWNGKTYSGEGDPQLAADRLSYYTKLHDDTARTIDNAYKSGLITFEERKKSLDQNRQSIIDQQAQVQKDATSALGALDTTKQGALGSIQASYSQASPDAIQSSQTDYANKAIDQYNQGVGQVNDVKTQNLKSIDLALGNIGTASDTAQTPSAYGDLYRNQADYNTTYQNNLAANDQALVGQKDQTANDVANYTAKQQAAAGKAAATQSANINQIDTNQLLSGLAGTYKQFADQGFTPEQIQSSLRNGLQQAKVDPSQIDPILNYFYGVFGPQQAKTTGLSIAR